jgi:hypothetical protein
LDRPAAPAGTVLGARPLPFRDVDRSQADQAFGLLRELRERAPERRARAGKVSVLEQRLAEPVLDARSVGELCGSGAKKCPRLDALARLLERDGAVEPPQWVFRIELRRVCETRGRLDPRRGFASYTNPSVPCARALAGATSTRATCTFTRLATSGSTSPRAREGLEPDGRDRLEPRARRRRQEDRRKEALPASKEHVRRDAS